MSPLLCQLSYTATAKALACKEHNFTRGRISLSTKERRQWFMSAGDEDDGDAGFG